MEPQVLTLRCPQCGDMVPVTAQFCGNCGERITEEMKQLRNRASGGDQFLTLRCPQCGNMVPVTARFCRSCGSKVSASSPPTPQPMEMGRPLDGMLPRPPAAAQDQGTPTYQGRALPVNKEPNGGTPIGRVAALASKNSRFFQQLGSTFRRLLRRNPTQAFQAGQPGRDPQITNEAAADDAHLRSASKAQAQNTQQTATGTSPGTPGEPAPDRQGSIIPAIDRVSAKTVTNLPMPVGLMKSLQPTPINSPTIAQAAPSIGVAAARGAPIVISQRQPDGPAAPLPRNQKLFRRRVIGGSLAALLVLVVAGGIALKLYTPVKDPTLVVPTQLGAYPATSSLAASSLTIQPNWAEAAASTIASQADKIANLPELPSQDAAVLNKDATSTLAGRLNTLNGLSQAQMNVSSPMDVSLASNALFLVEAVDGGLQIVDTKQEKVLSLGFVQFFRGLMQHSSDVFGEPRVIFDPTSQLWVLVANEVSLDNGNVVASYFDIAISTSSSPLAPWHVYQLSTQTQEYGGCNWGDAPQLGSNSSGFFISGSIFNCGIDGVLKGVVLWKLPKIPFAQGKRGPTSKWVGFTNTSGQPLLSLVPAIEAGSTTTEWLVANDAGYVDNGRTSQSLSIWAVTPDSSPRTPLPGITVALRIPYADPPQARQPTPNQNTLPSQRLSTGDARITSAQYINNHLYTAFTTAVNWQGDTSTRSGIYWLDFSPSLPSQSAPSARLVQSGILGLSKTYTFMPALVADGEGNLVLSAQISSSSLYPGIVYSSRLNSDPLGQMGGTNNTLTFLQQVSVPFGTGRDHWGDYAGGSLVFLNSNQASPDIWIAAPVINPGSQSDQGTISWHTSMWEFDTGGNTVQNIE